MNTLVNESIEVMRRSYEVSRCQMESIMEQQGRLRDAAEAMALDTRKALERVAVALCPGIVDDYCKASPEGLARVTSSKLADVVIENAGRKLLLLDATTAAGQTVHEAYESLSVRIANVERERDKLSAELKETKLEKDKLETRLALVESQLEKHNQSDTQASVPSSGVVVGGTASVAGPVPDDRLPGWVREWRKTEGYERDKDLLCLLAKTGAARRSKVARELAEMWDLNPHGGSMNRLFERCEGKRGFITLESVTSETKGVGKQYLLYLTELGRDACRLELGLEAVESQVARLIKRHKSKEHVLLNLEAGDLLRDAGYAVDLFPSPTTLPSGGRFDPDLMASLNGRTLFVEVERDVWKHQDEWARKWEIVYEATGGEIYVVVANKTALDTVRSGIVFSVGKRPLTLCMASISETRGRGLQGQDLWTIVRRGDR